LSITYTVPHKWSGEVTMVTPQLSSVNTPTDDDNLDNVPSVNDMLREKGVDDPATMHILFTMNISTAADLHRKTIEDLIQVISVDLFIYLFSMNE
jgi:hypothetical protein